MGLWLPAPPILVAAIRDPLVREVARLRSRGYQGRSPWLVLDINYRAHPGVDTALELVHPGCQTGDLNGLAGLHGRR